MRCSWTTILETGASKISKALYNPRNTFHNFTLLLLLCLFLPAPVPAPVPLPVVAFTVDVVAAAGVADAILLLLLFLVSSQNLFAGARFSWFFLFVVRFVFREFLPVLIFCHVL